MNEVFKFIIIMVMYDLVVVSYVNRVVMLKDG